MQGKRQARGKQELPMRDSKSIQVKFQGRCMVRFKGWTYSWIGRRWGAVWLA